MATASIQAGTLPADYCPSSYQTMLSDFANYLRVILSGSLGINTGNSVPAVADQGNPWFRYNADGTPDGWYVYTTGSWLSPHPDTPGTVKMYYSATPVASTFFETYDGGEAGVPVSPWKNGQMWEVLTPMAARSPIAPGTTAAGTILTAGNNYGEDKHTLLETELPPHRHAGRDYDASSSKTDVALYSGRHWTGVDNNQVVPNGGDSTPFNNIHPVFCLWFIVRTARLYKRV